MQFILENKRLWGQLEFNKYENLLKPKILQPFENNLSFNLYVVLSACWLIITLEVEVEFNGKNTNRIK